MKTGLVKKLAIVLLAFAAAAATCFGAASLNGSVSGVNAETAYEATYLTGFRSNNATVMHFYWRIDGADLGKVLATLNVNYTSGGETTSRKINLQYTTASTQGVTGDLGGTSDRRQGKDNPVATTHPCIYIDISPAAQSGDSFTIPAGTVIGNKYALTQDYTVTFNGTNWLFTEESAIPLEITGFRTAVGANAVYLYGGKILEGYYFNDITLSKSVTLDYIPAGGTQTTKTGATIKPETVKCVNNGNISTSAMLLSWNGNCNEGDVIVLKKGTKLDNFVLTRDYKLTKTASDWKCELSSEEGDELLNLTLRGGGANQLNLFCDETMNFDYVSDEQLSTAAVVYKNDEKIVVAVNALAMSGNKPSFCLKTTTAFQSGDIVKVPAGFVVAGYKTNKDYMFKWDGAKWEVYKEANSVKSISISLNGDIALNFYTKVVDEDVKVYFTVDGETEEATSYVTASDGQRVYSYSLAVKDYAKNVTLTIGDGEGAVSATSSVKDYIAAAKDTFTGEVKALVDNLDVYCGAAEKYFAGETVDTTDMTDDGLSNYAAVKTGELPEGVSVSGITLILESTTTIRIYVTGDNANGATYKIDGEIVSVQTLSDGTMYIEQANIAAKDIDRTYTFELGGCTTKLSALSYANSVVNGGASNDENLINLLKAMYNYSVAANAYFDANA